MSTWSVATTWLPCSTWPSRSPILAGRRGRGGAGGTCVAGMRVWRGMGRAGEQLCTAVHPDVVPGGAVGRQLACCRRHAPSTLPSPAARPASTHSTCWRGAAPSPGPPRARAAAAPAPPAPPRTCGHRGAWARGSALPLARRGQQPSTPQRRPSTHRQQQQQQRPGCVGSIPMLQASPLLRSTAARARGPASTTLRAARSAPRHHDLEVTHVLPLALGLPAQRRVQLQLRLLADAAHRWGAGGREEDGQRGKRSSAAATECDTCSRVGRPYGQRQPTASRPAAPPSPSPTPPRAPPTHLQVL